MLENFKCETRFVMMEMPPEYTQPLQTGNMSIDFADSSDFEEKTKAHQ